MKTTVMNTTLGTPRDGRLDRFFDNDWHFPDLFGGLTRLEPEFRVEEIVDGDELIVRAEAPGINPDTDVDISMANGKLYISIERRESLESKGDKTTRSEFRYGSFSRTMKLPEGTEPSAVRATYTDGILEVRLPMPATTPASTKVPIVRGETAIERRS